MKRRGKKEKRRTMEGRRRGFVLYLAKEKEKETLGDLGLHRGSDRGGIESKQNGTSQRRQIGRVWLGRVAETTPDWRQAVAGV